jgi:hypothetical protein
VVFAPRPLVQLQFGKVLGNTSVGPYTEVVLSSKEVDVHKCEDENKTSMLPVEVKGAEEEDEAKVWGKG